MALGNAPYHLRKLVSICDLSLKKGHVMLEYKGSDRACTELLSTHFDSLKELIREGFDPSSFELRTSKEQKQVSLKSKDQVTQNTSVSLPDTSHSAGQLHEPDYSTDPRWQALIKKATLQMRAYLKPAVVKIEPSLLTIEFAQNNTFHGMQALRKANELAQLVADVFGTMTLKVITSKEQQTIDVISGRNYLSDQLPKMPSGDATDQNATSEQTLTRGASEPRKLGSTEATKAQTIRYFGQLTPDNTTSMPSDILSDLSLAGHTTSNLKAGTIHTSTLIPDGRRELFSVGSFIVWCPETTPRRGDYQIVRLENGRYGIGIHEAPPLQAYITAEADPFVEWSATLEKARFLGTLVQVRTKLWK